MSRPGRFDPIADRIDGHGVYDLIRTRAAATPDAVMLIDEDRLQLTFGEYHAAVLEMAGVLLRSGILPGSRVAWQLENSLRAVVLTGALSRLGASQVLLLQAYRTHDLEHIVDESAVATLIVEESDRFDFIGQAKDLQPNRPGLQVLSMDALPATGDDLPEYRVPALDETRWIIYTSGTTGPAKGVRHSDGSVIAGAKASHIPPGTTSKDRGTLNYPFGHIGGIMGLCTMMCTGSSTVVVKRFQPEFHVPLFRELGVTIPGAGPPFFRLYLAEQRKQPGISILPAARLFQGGGSPKSSTMHEELSSEIGAGLFTGYGMSECPMITTMHEDSPEEQKSHSEGVPAVDTEVRVIGSDGREVAQGEEGEIAVRGPQLFLGYVDPAADRAAFDDEGFYRTGDLGRFDDEGYVHLTGRLKDLIIRKGENISSLEIERMLAAHPTVAEVAVVGVPDDERGEMCCAVVVSTGARLTLDEMRDYLAGAGLPMFKIPERLEFMDALPKNVMNKVLKTALRSALTATAPAAAR